MNLGELHCPICGAKMQKCYRQIKANINGKEQWVEYLNASICYDCDKLFERVEGKWVDRGEVMANLMVIA